MTASAPHGPTRSPGAKRYLAKSRAHPLVRAGAIILSANAIVLILNLATGVIVARSLGAAGRGQIAAIQVVATFMGWTVGMGCYQAVTYH